MKEKNFLLAVFLVLIISITIFQFFGFNINNYDMFKFDGNKYINLSTHKQTNFIEDDTIVFNIDDDDSDDSQIILNGWAIIKGQDSKSNIKLLLKGNNNAYLINMCSKRRNDVTKAFKDGNNYSNSGFYCNIDTSNFKKDNYKMYIAIRIKENYLIKEINLE